MKQIEISKSMLFVNENKKQLKNLIDSNPRTKWIGSQTPAYFEVRFEEIYRLERFVLKVPKGICCIFAVFASSDLVNYTEVLRQDSETLCGGIYDLPCDFTAAGIRVLIKYDSGSSYARVRGIELFGESIGEAVSHGKEIYPCSFADSEFNVPLTEKDTIDELYALVGRTVGTEYASWFDFILSNDGSEYFSLEDADHKIRITANSGVNLAAGLGWYYKYYCNVHFSQVGCNRNMPKEMPKIGKPFRRTTPFAVRYAYNYCALSYTMPFWGAEEWQTELDLLALQGVNVILDITALEEVWRRFLLRLGYSNDEARAFITGPAYYAWFNMANIYGCGGPVPPQFFSDRTALARRNHLFMRKLGMQPVLQGFSGMVPTDIKDRVKDASVILQGLWNGLERPAMLRTNTDCYRRLARIFYECQKEVFGKTTNYYATDPFHEGGKAGAMNLATVGKVIMTSLLESDPDAVWILQSWGENPSRALVEGIAPWKDHTLILDLYAEKRPHWENFLDREFLNSPWVYCMLNNFGGRMGLHGHLRTIANEVARAANTAKHMKGVGITPEATFSNPIIFDLFFETIWTDQEKIQPIDLDKWLRRYAVRRYGSCPNSMYNALLLLNDTVYNPELNEKGEGAPESVINVRPRLHPKSASSWGNHIIAYDKADFEKAVSFFTRDINSFIAFEGYRFDLVDFLKQILANTAQEYQKLLDLAYEMKDVIEYRKWADKYLQLIHYTDDILSAEKTFLLGTWLKKAKQLAANYDDFTKQMFEFNARAQITTWAGSEQAANPGGLHDYSNKQWNGLTEDFYGKRWQVWIKKCLDELEGKKTAEPNWFRIENRWTWQTNDYPSEPSDLDLKAAAENVMKKYSVKTAAIQSN